MERKPAAIDSVVFKQEQQYASRRHFVSNSQASNEGYQNINEALQDQAAFETKLNDRNIFPKAPVERGLCQSPRVKELKKYHMKAPPVASYARGNRRSNMISTRTLESEVRSKKTYQATSEFARSKLAALSKLNEPGSQNRTSALPMKLLENRGKEASTPRKAGALQTWLKRLYELIEFRETNGHGKKFPYSSSSLFSLHLYPGLPFTYHTYQLC